MSNNVTQKSEGGRRLAKRHMSRCARLGMSSNAVERWAAKQKDATSRSEAIRRLVEIGLAKSRPRGIK
jgi:hypothetical protein